MNILTHNTDAKMQFLSIVSTAVNVNVLRSVCDL